MSDYAPILSGITGGSFLNAMLYMLEIVQVASYLKHFWKRDVILIKTVVVLCFLIDTMCTIAIFSWVLMSDVIHWGDDSYLAEQYWPTPTYVVCTTVVGALVQTFLITRYYILTSHRIVSLVLGFFVLTALAGGIFVAIIFIFFANYADRYKAMVTTTIWLLSTALVDVFIAVSLVITLSKASSRTTIRRTQNMIQRLILTAVQSGTITTLLALLMLGVYLAKPSTNDSAYFSFCLGRAYTLTMLFNLNLRRSLDDKCHTCGVNAEGISLSSVICTSGKHLPAELMYPKDREYAGSRSCQADNGSSAI